MAGRPSVDGSIEEWGERLTPVDGASVSVAAHPTDSLLYVALLVQDRALVRSLAVHGLVVWVDPAGGQRRAYGVQYPLGLRRQRAGQQQPATSGQGPASEQGPAGLDDVSLTELEVVRGDTARQRIPARFSSGLRGKAVLDPSSLIYEVAIPVGASADAAGTHGLGTALSGPVGLGLEISEPEEDDEASTTQGGGIGSVTGRRGRRRGRRGRRGRRQRQQRQQQSGPQFATLDLWMTVPAGAQP
jgi:hypothetical protein